MVAGIAWVGERRPIPALRWLAAALVLVVSARIVWEPQIAHGGPGTTPILNWLLYGYGVPALSFSVAGWLMRKSARDNAAQIVDSAAIAFTAALGFVEIRHLMNGGDIYALPIGLAEMSVQVSAAFILAIGLERLRERSRYVVHDRGAMALTALALGGAALGLALMLNPWWSGVDVGGPVVNLLALGYLLPAILAGALAYAVRRTRPPPYAATVAAAALGLTLLYLLLEVTRLFRGGVLTAGTMSDAEQYAYSAVLLGFGVVLLFLGIATGSRPARLASGVVVLLAVGKVFLVDLAGLTGGFRALSFIGLGLVLVGIGWLYQRLLFPAKNADAANPPQATGEALTRE